jgi:hypothetical protein
MDYGQIIAVLGGIALFFAIYIFIVRWIFKVDSIVFYLDKINEKLARIEEEQKKRQQ